MSEHVTNLEYLKPEVLQKIGDLEIIAREIVQGLRIGTHRSNLKGFSTEFAHHRPYAVGDAIRDIDWRVYSRTDRFYTRLYEAETNYDCYLLMDASTSMNYTSGTVTKLDYGKYLSAALAYLVLNQRDSVGLSIFDAKVRTYLPPKSTMGIILDIEKLLKEIEPMPKNTLSKQLLDISMMIKRRSFVVVVSDLLSDVDDVMKGLNHLRLSGHNVVVLHTLDPYELSFPFKGTWKFNALESEQELITQPERIKEDYMKNLNKYLEEINTRCIASGIDYSLVDTSKAVDSVLSEFLHIREANLKG
jgi:uncharacterized protein (DUF58 family)